MELPAYPYYQDLVCKADLNLRLSVIFDSHQSLCPIFPSILPRRPGLRNRFHPFDYPGKDTKYRNIIPRVLYSARMLPIATPLILPLGPIVAKNYSFSRIDFCYYCIICIFVDELRYV